MPIYEFYCSDCHKIFKFLSRRPDPDKRPACPRCQRPELERRYSLFAVSKGLKESPASGDSAEPEIDESRLERAMQLLEREADGIQEDNPRQMAGLMRKIYDATGLKLGSTMEEAIQRMESGEDPDAIEGDLGDALEAEDPFGAGELKEARSRLRKMLPPTVDDTLYDL